jgi:signal transduction histidine kinase
MKKEVNVLIIEDSLPDAFLIGEYLSECENYKYNSFHSEYLQDGLDRIESDEVDIVLIDLHLPDSNGSVRLGNTFQSYSHIPFIVLTGLSDKTVATSLLNKGAKDYLVKGQFNADQLERAMLYTLERKRVEEHYIKEILTAQDTEKERIARDVHDSLGQNLTSAVLQLEHIKSESLNKNNQILDSIDIALSCLNEAIIESRGISRSLMPQTVQKFGIESGIESILLTLGKNSTTYFNFHSEIESFRFLENIELTFFRIAQESINNILKYSKSKNANISLTYKNQSLEMVIEDDGIGFDSNHESNQKGIGLSSIKTRAMSISGNLRIKSIEGKGTKIIISVKTQSKILSYESN